jgi:hypothetical protein
MVVMVTIMMIPVTAMVTAVMVSPMSPASAVINRDNAAGGGEQGEDTQ